MNSYNDMIQGIQWVLDNRSSYRIGKDLGINNRTANRYQNGETPIENMSLKIAKTFYEYYLDEKDSE